MKIKKMISMALCAALVTSLAAGAVFIKNTKVRAEEMRYVSLSVLKVWDDYDDYDGLRPEKIEATLYRMDEMTEITTVTLSEDNGWYYELPKLMPKYDSEGNEIPYEWVSDTPEGYEEHYTDRLDNMTILTDCHEVSDTKKDEITLENLDEKEAYLDGCEMKLSDAEGKELIRWTSGDKGSISVLDESLQAVMDNSGSLKVKGLEEGNYRYESVKAKDGYTAGKNRQFKVRKIPHNYSYHWYTDFTAAVSDANNLTAENADCYRNAHNAAAGLFIIDNTAHLILLKDVSEIFTFGLDQNTVFDLESHSLTFSEGNGLQYCGDLKLLDGTINLTNIARGINGLVSATYQSDGRLEMDSMNIVHKSGIGGTRTVNTFGSDIRIENSTFDISYSAGGYGMALLNPDGNAVFYNNQITASNTGTSTLYTINSALKTLVLEENNIKTESGKTAYGVNVSGTSVNVVSGGFTTESSGGNAIGIYAKDSSLTVDYMEGYSKSTAPSGWTQGIYAGEGSVCIINDCDIKSEGTMYNNVGLYVGAGGEAEVYGGHLYAMPVSTGKDNDSYGCAIRNQGSCLIEERNGKSVTASGGHSGIQSDYGSRLTINSGTLESPNHGGAYLCNGAAGFVEINGGTFRNNYYDYDETILGDYSGNGIHNYGALYIGHPPQSGQKAWSIDIRNARIEGNATWGMALRSDDGYVPATVNLYNTYVSGRKADIWVSGGSTIGTYGCFVNLYEGTTLGHNTVFDQYGVQNNEAHIIDYRQNADELETITQ